MQRLNGKVVIVTGAGRGIGRQHALLFAQQGARVVVNDAADSEDGSASAAAVVEQIEAAGGIAVPDSTRVGSSDAAESLVAKAVDTFGQLDVLVNNAGILRDRTILKMTDQEWDDVLRVHLSGSFFCLQAAARRMVQQETGGRIINTTSSSGLLGNFGQANYGAAKAGIHALTRIAALEFGRYQITVNAVAPLAATDMLATMPGTDMDVVQEALHPGRIAPLVVFLATDAASEISGVTFGVEGNELFTYRMLTSHGVTRHEQTAWTLEAIEASIQQIIDW